MKGYVMHGREGRAGNLLSPLFWSSVFRQWIEHRVMSSHPVYLWSTIVITQFLCPNWLPQFTSTNMHRRGLSTIVSTSYTVISSHATMSTMFCFHSAAIHVYCVLLVLSNHPSRKKRAKVKGQRT